MTYLRSVLLGVAFTAGGYAVGSLLLGMSKADFGVSALLACTAVIAIGYIDRLDAGRHEAVRRGRETVWQRRTLDGDEWLKRGVR